MRLSSVAAGILTLGLAGYPAIGTIMAPAAGSPRQLSEGSRGPMTPSSSARPSGTQQTQQDQTPTTQQTVKVATQVVNVFATIRDKKNGIVSDLSKDDFRVYEDSVEQKVAFFSKEMNLPITLAILMDTSGSMLRNMDAEKDAASRFVQTVMHKQDEAIVLSFDLDVNLLAEFTEDPRVLERAIRRAEVNAAGPVITPGTLPQSGGGTNLYDALYLACHDELGPEAGRKAIVAITDAEDNGSKMTENDAIEAAQRADAVVHFVLITDPRATEGYGPGVASRIAQNTGGRVINVRSEKSLEKAFDVITEELRSQYVLGYYPLNTNHDGTFRKIKVEITRSDVKVLARKGYYAPSH